MKKLNVVAGLLLIMSPALVMVSCTNNDSKYKNLQTGEKVYIIQSESGQAIDSISGSPVEFYVNTETQDTIYGETGEVVNNKLIKTSDDVYKLDESKFKTEIEEMMESDDVKIKVDGDDMKIKTDDKKIKIEDGEKKVKYDN
ncbi:hypothetical protein [Pedobacter alpinus]|uniref:Lipoprotein n=1 Tax=Pedobacter alpinus TaxID=1590643 RepID=A0ABW5TQ52_9SPHI